MVLITCRLQGRQPPRFTREVLEKLKRMFAAIQRPFEESHPEERRNFLSYLFCLYKFLELLGAYEWLPYFALLKGRAKLAKQDEMWKKICAHPDLQWQYIPTDLNGG